MILVPTDAPGFNLVRPVPVMGHDGGPGHCEIRYEDCRVPEANLLGARGERLHGRPGPARARDGSTTACARSAPPSVRSS